MAMANDYGIKHLSILNEIKSEFTNNDGERERPTQPQNKN